MTAIDKSLIKKQFNKGFKDYDKEASVQKKLAEILIAELCAFTSKPLSHIFEVGCGTGFITQQILKHLAFENLTVNDIAPKSEEKIKTLETTFDKHLKFIEGDVETIELPIELDAVISGATFQWLNNLPAFMDTIHKSLNPNGLLAFSTFGNENYKEIKTLTNVGLRYMSLDEITGLLSEKFNILYSDSWNEIKTFNTPIEVLKHMKKTGVNGIRKSQFNKSQIDKFTLDYKRCFSNKDQTVSLTYNPILIIAQKK